MRPSMRIGAAVALAAGVFLHGFALAGGAGVGLIPITELGAGAHHGFPGGLYPGGANTPPEAHADAAMAAASLVLPRSAAGAPDPDGLIVMLSIGMSNTTQEFAVFERDQDANPGRNARLVILNGALGGQTAAIIADPAQVYWTVVHDRLAAMGVTPEQVQVVWLKQANAGPPNNFPVHAMDLRDNLRSVVQNLRDFFPNLQLCYMSSRTYGGYATTGLNPEPMAYESAFSVKWLIEEQIAGAPELNPDPDAGPVRAPLLLWGPYLWADGLTPRADGLTWEVGDFNADGTHPSPSGEQKVANLLSQFFLAEPTAQPWFPAQPGESLVVIDAEADATVDAAAPNQSFGLLQSLVVLGGGAPRNSYIRFDTSSADVANSLIWSKLSLRVSNTGAGPRDVSLVTNSSWTEPTITFNNAPPIDGGLLVSVPRLSNAGSFAAAVGSAVAAEADGRITFAITTADTQPSSYRSRQSPTNQPPRLVLALRAPVCPADLDGDGVAGSADLAILLGAWGPNPGAPADLDGDGAVTSADLAILLGAWGAC